MVSRSAADPTALIRIGLAGELRAASGRNRPWCARRADLGLPKEYTGRLMLRTFLRRLLSRGPSELLQPGTKAPAFRVHDHRGQLVDSADLAGRRFVLWFYPKAATPG